MSRRRLIIVWTTESLTQEIGGMRVVDQNYYTFVVQLKRTCGYDPQDGSLNLSEGTKDDRKRRTTNTEGCSQGYTLRIGIQSKITVLM